MVSNWRFYALLNLKRLLKSFTFTYYFFELRYIDYRRHSMCSGLINFFFFSFPFPLESVTIGVLKLLNLPLRSNKLNNTGQFPMLLTKVIADQTFWYSSLEALTIHSFVMGFTYFTARKQDLQR